MKPSYLLIVNFKNSQKLNLYKKSVTGTFNNIISYKNEKFIFLLILTYLFLF